MSSGGNWAGSCMSAHLCTHAKAAIRALVDRAHATVSNAGLASLMHSQFAGCWHAARGSLQDACPSHGRYMVESGIGQGT